MNRTDADFPELEFNVHHWLQFEIFSIEGFADLKKSLFDEKINVLRPNYKNLWVDPKCPLFIWIFANIFI